MQFGLLLLAGLFTTITSYEVKVGRLLHSLASDVDNLFASFEEDDTSDCRDALLAIGFGNGALQDRIEPCHRLCRNAHVGVVRHCSMLVWRPNEATAATMIGPEVSGGLKDSYVPDSYYLSTHVPRVKQSSRKMKMPEYQATFLIPHFGIPVNWAGEPGSTVGACSEDKLMRVAIDASPGGGQMILFNGAKPCFNTQKMMAKILNAEHPWTIKLVFEFDIVEGYNYPPVPARPSSS